MPRQYDDDDYDDLDIRKPGQDGQVPNYLVQAIMVTLCCCLPFGVAAIVQAAKVNTLLAEGKYDEAVQASEQAKKWCWIAFFLGIIGNALYIGIQVMDEMNRGGFR